MKESEDLIKGSLYLSIAKLLSNLALLFSIIVVARIIGSENYGLYVVAISLVGLLNSFGGFGIGPYLSATLPRLRKTKNRVEVISTTFWVNFLLSAFLTVLSFLFLPNFSITPLLVEVASFSIILSLLFAYFINLFISIKRAGISSILNVAQSFSQAFSSILFAFLGFGMFAPLLSLELGYSVAILLAFLFLNKLKIKILPRISKKEVFQLFSFSFFIIISAIFPIFSNRFAIVYLSKFVEASTIGNIGIVQNFIVVSDIIVASIASVAMPIFAEKQKTKSRIFGIAFKYSFFLLLFPILLLFFFPKFVILILFGKGYEEAIFYLKLFSIYLLFSFPSYLFSSFLLAEKRIKLNAIVSVISSLVLIALLPIEGILKANGYFVAIIASAFFSNLFCFLIIRSSIELRKKEILKLAFVSLALFFVSNFISNFVKTNLEFFVSCFLLLFVYSVSFKFVVSKNEIQSIKNALEHSRLKRFLPFVESFWNFLGLR